jgi:glycosyltransferase involved in cell wall biosynthesis
VLERLRDSAVSVVPSRHCYGEGLPLTIYEAWATRTPLVAADHPMFRQRVIDGLTGLVVPERDPGALGRALVRVLAEPALYRRLSENASIGWQLLKGSVGFWPLVWDWLDDRLTTAS